MRQLFLLRHAKSSWDDPSLADHDRPLAPRGERACKVMARHLSSEGIAPELVLCSSSARTRATLDGVAGSFSDDVRVEVEEGLYAASDEELIDRLRAVDDGVDSVMLIGHNPGIEDLALTLAGSGDELDAVRQKFPTAALATLEFSGTWAELSAGDAELTAFVKPKQLS